MAAQSKTSKLFPQPKTAYEQAPSTNYEGAPTFDLTNEEKLLCYLTTATFDNTFYASAKGIADSAVEVFKAFAVSDPHFLAKAIVYARNEGLMRYVPITALVVLSTAPEKAWFKLAFPQVIRTPGDLQDFVALVKSGRFRNGFGRSVKAAINEWLSNISEYHVIKYGSSTQEFTLRDILRITKPKLQPGSQADRLAAYLTKGDVAESLTQVKAFESLKTAVGQVEQLRLIGAGKLPYEAVTAVLQPCPSVWEALLYQAPYMNLMRNLNTFHKHGVFDTRENVDYAVKVLSDPDRVRKAKQFPFRYLSAVENFVGDQKIREALYDALEAATNNVPELGERVLVCNDISGSMSTQTISPRSKTKPADIAGLLGAICFKRSQSGEVVSFEKKAVPRQLSRRDSTMSISRTINKGSGGTNLSAPIRWMVDNKKPFDTAIFITDNESWVDHFGGSDSHVFGSYSRGTDGRGALDEIRDYKRTVNPNLKCFFMQTVPYEHRVVPPEEPGCWFLFGWSDSIVKFIALQAQGASAQLEYVRNMRLETVPRLEGQDAEDTN